MSPVVEDVIAFCRMFSSFEREEVCCGTVSPAQCVLLQTLTEGEWDEWREKNPGPRKAGKRNGKR